jgi:hypothetical protein
MTMTTKKHPKPRQHVATDAELAELARESSRVHDEKMVKLCGRALAGGKAARRECGRVLVGARALAKHYAAKG